MRLLTNLISFGAISLTARAAIPLGYVRVRQSETNSTATTEAANSTSTEPVENYYNGVRCDWWCPDFDKTKPPIDPPNEEDGCICEIPDTRPASEQTFDLIESWLGGFKADDYFPNHSPCASALRHSINDMNMTIITWGELFNTTNSTENSTEVSAEPKRNFTEAEKVQYYLFNTTEWISYDLSKGARHCYGVGLDWYDYVAVK